MNCRSYRDALTAFLDNELDRDEQGAVQLHLSGCEECQQEYDSLLLAFDLTEQVDSIPLNPAIWNRVKHEITPAAAAGQKGLEEYLRMLLVPIWRPVAAGFGAVAIALFLFFSLPDNSPDPALEREFTEFLQKRERTSRENRRILSEPQFTRDPRRGNPFVKPVSYERMNPFRE